ncbi:microcin C transport system permease protein [Roseimicrobium gellanilyticum]|uniref:Microcin C transport system permease protein n=1 Tax=Roseimicrobium gellanilyticum TaxID=748857 RepID=A0A366HHZ8_9BACT|nr:ABC transporter permease subunit [Roseimicrobium gellanilyticum]RBP42341.1 microcin C transport system permease protein [Roseimicrobium gellanilyticum]
MTPRRLGILLCLYAVISAVCRWFSFRVPILKVPFLSVTWVGWALLVAIFATGIWLISRGRKKWQFSPLTVKQFKRFRSVKRGYVSFLILMLLAGVAALDNLIVGNRALVVSYQGSLHFPFVRDVIPGTTFGQSYDSETNYRELKELFRKEGKGNWVVMPPVPYAPMLDSPQVVEELTEKDGKVYSPTTGGLFNGRAYSSFTEKPAQKRQEWVFRKGLRHGEMLGWNLQGEQVEKARFETGKQIEYTDYSDGKAAALSSAGTPTLQTVIYPPSAPSLLHNHWLGTNTAGGDVFAILFGGWQQVVIASVLFLVAVFGIGVLFGGTMGYFGGWYDLFGQRIIEIWSSLPFLFVVVIVSSLITPSLVVLVAVIAAFSWMGTTAYVRTAAFREKARDYVSAARLTGASTGRVVFKHILPNSIAILVTLAPFEVSAVIYSLAALDFLGFGLPPEEPSWGRLLREGTENFNYPWIVSSAFFALVIVLLLVTFVGEAIREAFDPKKFTTYE